MRKLACTCEDLHAEAKRGALPFGYRQERATLPLGNDWPSRDRSWPVQ